MTNQPKRKGGKIRVPLCPQCNEGMVFTFAFPYKEYACLPCGTTKEFLCEKAEVLEEENELKKKKWSKDLHKIALEQGGAICKECEEARSCEDCKEILAHDFEYYDPTK